MWAHVFAVCICRYLYYSPVAIPGRNAQAQFTSSAFGLLVDSLREPQRASPPPLESRMPTSHVSAVSPIARVVFSLSAHALYTYRSPPPPPPRHVCGTERRLLLT